MQSNYIDTPASGITLETEYGFAPYNWPNKNISVLDNTVVNSQAEPLKIDSAENVRCGVLTASYSICKYIKLHFLVAFEHMFV